MKLNITNINYANDQIVFSIAWNEAWSNAVNNDGVYVFAKYKEKGIWKQGNRIKFPSSV